jgi:hypothetical protein
MTLSSLQALTWSTVTGAVLSALLLAAGESGLPDLNRLRRGDAVQRPLPTDAPAAAAQHQSGPDQAGRVTQVRQRQPAAR